MSYLAQPTLLDNLGYRVPEASAWLVNATGHRIGTSSVSVVRRRFATLANEWRLEKLYLSSTDDIVALPSYREIIAMGDAAIPLILEALRASPDHWFHALREMTGEDPVHPNSRGRLRAMTQDWIDWGRRVGYLK